MFKLYEVDYQIDKVLREHMDENGEITTEGCMAMEAIELNKEVKVLNTAKLIKSVEAEAQAIKDAEKSMASRRKVLENKVKSLKNYLTRYAVGEEFSDAEIQVKWRKSFKLPDDYDKGLVPDSFKIKTEVVKIDGIGLTKAIKSGEFMGFSLIQNNNIQIK